MGPQFGFAVIALDCGFLWVPPLPMPLLSKPATQRAETDHRAHEEDTVTLGIFSVGGNALAQIDTQLACYGRTVRNLVSDTLGLSTCRFKLICSLGELRNEDMLCERIVDDQCSLTIVFSDHGAKEHSDD